MKKILLYFFIIFSVSNLFSQNISRQKYDATWYMQFNGGVTWQDTDVKNRFGGAGSFILGKTYNRYYGSLLTFDLRARYLYGHWRGLDRSLSTIGIGHDPIYSESGTNYSGYQGHVVNNFVTKNHKLNLELVISANRLRERTKIDLYAFGGIGLSFNKTFGNLLDFSENLYDYNSLPNNFGKKDLLELLDESSETRIDGARDWNVQLMPSIGLGLGYEIAKDVMLGIEHKTTFAMHDNFDGFKKTHAKYPNDIYHFTGIYLKFYLGHYHDKQHDKHTNHQTSHQTHPNNNNNPVVVTPTPTQSRVPDVKFTQPSVAGTTVENPSYTLVAQSNFANVAYLFQNGRQITNFSFNKTNGTITANIALEEGNNNFEVIVENNFGKANDLTNIYLHSQNNRLPIIQYTNPPITPYSANTNIFNITANIWHVEYADQIRFEVNGQPFTNFTYHPNSLAFDATIPLIYGNNVVTITATNQAGSVSENVVINNNSQREQLPSVYFTNPSRSPYTVNNPNFQLYADVYNVTNANNIIFKQNGVRNSNFTFNPHNNSFSSNVVLNAGQNIFEIIASNSSGSANATTVLIYERPVQQTNPPIITYTNPPVTPFVTESNLLVLAANVFNVTQKSQIKFYFNGVQSSSFNYNNNTSLITANLNLNQGNNIVNIIATNAGGSTSRETVINYSPAIQKLPPVVNILSPNSNPFTTNNSTLPLIATINNLESNAGSSLTLNGNAITNYSFNLSTSALNANLSLIEGTNTIVVKGTNSVGTDQKTLTVYYRKPASGNPPIITLLQPNSNNSTVFEQLQEIKAKVQNVTNSNQIVVKVNGSTLSNVDYQASSEILTFNTTLNQGSNSITIKATNQYGSDDEALTITYKAIASVNPPVVNFTTPQNNSVHNVNTVSVKAKVLNVTEKEQIDVKVNGNTLQNFVFNLANTEVIFTASLNEGLNNVQIIATNISGQDSDSLAVTFTKVIKEIKPIVTITRPTDNSTVQKTKSYTFNATVQNVTNQQDITVKFNGQTVSNGYSFNASNGLLSYTPNLNLGSNTFEVIATNGAGQDSDSKIVTYKLPEVICNAPEIKFINPTTNAITINENSFLIKASVKNAKSKEEITLKVNGIETVIDHYEVIGGNLTTKVNLKQGANAIQLIAKNACGSDIESISIVYEVAQQPCLVPTIQIINESKNQFTTSLNTMKVQASITNIVSNNEVKVLVNSVEKAFTFNPISKIVNVDASLNIGNNIIEFLAENKCGSTNKLVTIIRKECKKPVINIISSSIAENSSTSVSAFELTAHISDILSQNNITITQNNTPINFVYNTISNQVKIDRNLVIGKNTFVITANNSCGTDSKTFIVNRKEAVQAPPTVAITTPATTPIYVSEQSYTFKFQTTNITNVSQLVVKVNGVTISPSFNATTGIGTVTRNLAEGGNEFIVTATNNGGTASDQKVVYYRKPASSQKPPAIFVSNPLNCPATFSVGTSNVTGYVAGLTSVNQVSIKLNGVTQNNVITQFSDGIAYFTIPVTLVVNNPTVVLTINATNSLGSDSKVCNINVASSSQISTGNRTTTTPGKNVNTTNRPTRTTPTPNTNKNTQTEIKTNTTPTPGRR